MENVWVLACAWVGLAFIATLSAMRFNICAAHISLVVGGGASVLTFLVPTELDGTILLTKWNAGTVVGSMHLIGRPLLLLGCAASVKYVLRFLVGGAYLR